MNIANFITSVRILLIPVFISTFYLPISSASQITAVLFSLAAITDGLDGYLARYFKQASPLGAWLDPVADKLMVISALILVISGHNTPVLTIPVIVMICREIIVGALREGMALIGKASVTQVSWLGKLKTSAQLVSITLLLFNHSYQAESLIGMLGLSLLYIATLLTLVSLGHYLKAAWKAFYQ